MAKMPKWTSKEDGLLKDLYEQGLDDEVISKHLNRSKEAVRIRRSRIGATQGIVWDDERIKTELLQCVDQLILDRMPTASELKSIGRNDLHCKVSRTKKYSGWAKELGLKLKSSETTKGQKYEGVVKEIIKENGFEVERMSTRFPYDLLINGCVKVDVKSAKPHRHFEGVRAHTFSINKPNPTCDLYIIAALDEQSEIERTLIVPSHKLKMKSLNIGKESKWNYYQDRWDYLKDYVSFFSKIS